MKKEKPKGNKEHADDPVQHVAGHLEERLSATKA